MVRRMRRLLSLVLFGFVAASEGAVEVLRSSPSDNVAPIIGLLVLVTSVTFIVVLLTCGRSS